MFLHFVIAIMNSHAQQNSPDPQRTTNAPPALNTHAPQVSRHCVERAVRAFPIELTKLQQPVIVRPGHRYPTSLENVPPPSDATAAWFAFGDSEAAREYRR